MWRFRPGIPVEQQLQDLEKELSKANIRPEVASEFEEPSQQEAREVLVDSSGTLYQVVYAKGKRYRVALTEF